MEPPLGFTVHGVFTIQLRITMHGKKISIRLWFKVLSVAFHGTLNHRRCIMTFWSVREYKICTHTIEGQSVGNHGSQNTLKYDCTSGDIFHDLCLFDSKLISKF